MVAKFEENDDYMKDHKVKAEVVPVEKGDWERLTSKQVKEKKSRFLEDYFTIEPVDYGVPSKRTFYKSFDFIQQAKTAESKSVIKRLWSRYQRFFDDYESFMSEVISCVAQAVIQFDPNQDQFDWNTVNEKGSKSNTKLNAYIVKAGSTGISVLESLLQDYTNMIEWKKRSGANIDEFDMSSFDATVELEDEEEITLGEMLGEDSGLYAHQDGWTYDDSELDMVYQSNYHKPHFVVWWHEFLKQQQEIRNHKDARQRAKAVLTQHQIDYIEVMSKYFVGELITGIRLELENENENDEKVEALTYERQKKAIEIENLKRQKKGLKPYKVYTQDDIYNYNQIIRERVIEEYNRLHPQGGLTFYGMRRLYEMDVLKEMNAIIHPEPTGKSKRYLPTMEERQKELSDYVLLHFKENAIQDIVYGKLDAEDQGNVIAALTTKSEIPLRTMLNFISEIADRLQDLETANEDLIYTRKPFEYVDSKKKRKRNQVKSSEPKNGDVYVYDTKGNLKEVFTPKPMEKKYKERKATMGGLINDHNNF